MSRSQPIVLVSEGTLLRNKSVSALRVSRAPKEGRSRKSTDKVHLLPAITRLSSRLDSSAQWVNHNPKGGEPALDGRASCNRVESGGN